MQNELSVKLNDVVNLLKDSNGKGDVQLSILLTKNYFALIDIINNFVLNEDIDAELKTKQYIGILNELRIILNHLPLKYEKLVLDFNSLYNFVKMNLATLHYNSHVVSSFSQANLLMDIMVEPVDRILKLVDLPNIKEDMNGYSDLFTSELNLLMTSFGIYNSLISNIKVIAINDVIKWADEALWNFNLTIHLFIRDFDAEELLNQLFQKKAKGYFHNFLSYIMILNDMAFFSPKLLSLFHNKTSYFDVSTYHESFLPDLTIQSFKKLHDTIIQYAKYLINLIEDGKRNGKINRNDNIEDIDFYHDYLIGASQMQSLSLKYDLFIANKSIDQLLDISNKQIIESLIQSSKQTFTHIETIKPDVMGIIKSYYVNPYLTTFKDVLPFYALQSIYNKDTSIFEQFVDRFTDFITYSENTSELELLVILGKLFVLSQLNEEIDFLEIYTDIYSHLDYFQSQPSNYLASIILLINISPLLIADGEIEINININDLFDLAINHGIVQDESKIAKELELYKKYYKDPIAHEDQLQKLIYRREMVPFDYTTVLMPDLSMYYQQKKLKSYVYIPFNRYTDIIVE